MSVSKSNENKLCLGLFFSQECEGNLSQIIHAKVKYIILILTRFIPKMNVIMIPGQSLGDHTLLGWKL